MMLSSTMPESVAAEKGYYAVGGCGGNIAWHTENDTLEIADRAVMERDIKVYLALVVGIANARVLPFDWRCVTQEFQDTLRHYQQALGDAYSFSSSREALRSLEQRLQLFYEAVQNQAIPAAAANEAIRRLARILVPINHTLQPRFAHDAASAMPALPILAVATRWGTLGAEAHGFALTQIRRGENKLLDALRRAERELRLALN